MSAEVGDVRRLSCDWNWLALSAEDLVSALL